MKRQSLGKAEWEILQIIVEHAPVTVREAADFAAERLGVARTTVLTVMERLRKKGYLTRKKSDGLYRYMPRLPETELVQGLVKQFVSETLRGAVSPFFAYLSETAEVTDEEFAELKRLVKELEEQRKEGRR